MQIFSDFVFAMKNFFDLIFEGESAVDDAQKESILVCAATDTIPYYTIL
jgi:hypothetical protein